MLGNRGDGRRQGKVKIPIPSAHAIYYHRHTEEHTTTVIQWNYCFHVKKKLMLTIVYCVPYLHYPTYCGVYKVNGGSIRNEMGLALVSEQVENSYATW